MNEMPKKYYQNYSRYYDSLSSQDIKNLDQRTLEFLQLVYQKRYEDIINLVGIEDYQWYTNHLYRLEFMQQNIERNLGNLYKLQKIKIILDNNDFALVEEKLKEINQILNNYKTIKKYCNIQCLHI